MSEPVGAYCHQCDQYAALTCVQGHGVCKRTGSIVRAYWLQCRANAQVASWTLSQSEPPEEQG